MIKERTTSTRTAAVSIPGQSSASDHAWKNLEDELFPILREQQERVERFSKSKYDEITRRLSHVERQLRLLKNPRTASRKPLCQTTKYTNLVKETELISDDIQSLTRFCATQKLAFKKILKKYKKWTSSSSLELRYTNEIAPSGLLQYDYNTLLERLSDIMQSIESLRGSRSSIAPPARSDNNETESAANENKSSAARLHQACHDSGLDFDAKVETVPLGEAAGRARYWIHKDNLEEARVLLLRNMKAKELEPGPEVTHAVVFDNLQRYLQEEGAEPVGQSEALQGAIATKMALTLIWNDTEKATAVFSDMSPMKGRGARTAHVPRKKLSEIVQHRHNPGTYENDISSKQKLQDFLAQHRDVKPLSAVRSVRSRFVGLNNSTEVGAWAILDEEIEISKVQISSLGSTENSKTAKDGNPQAATSFPHAVLEVRWEFFSQTPQLVRSLDSSHLAERVRGFSIESLATHTQFETASKPLWLPILDKDIRRLPSPTRPSKRGRRSGDPSVSSGPPSATSQQAGVFSPTQLQSSATSVQESSTLEASTSHNTESAVKSSATIRKAHKPASPEAAPVRYWNEFDDGSELGDDDAYAIYVTPDEPFKFPGADAISKVWTYLTSFGRSGSRTGERQSLLRGQSADSSDSEAEIATSNHRVRTSGIVAISRSSLRRASRGASVEAGTRHRLRKARDASLLRASIGCFVLSLLFLLMSFMLRSVSRRKARGRADAGIVVGIVAAVCLGFVGEVCIITRRDTTLLPQISGFLALCVICVGSTIMVVVIASGTQ